MTFVQMPFIFLFFICKGFWVVEAMSLSAEEGGKLVIKCAHSYAQGNVKYFCKDPCYDSDVLITSKQKGNNKYSIRDTGNTFYVTISELAVADSGEYWCGVERVGKDTYTYVSIAVTESEDHIDNASIKKGASQKKLLVIGASLGALLLILLTALAVFIKHRQRDISKTRGDDVTFSDPLKYKQKPSPDTTSCSSANHSSELNPRAPEYQRSVTHKPTCDIYANVQNDDAVHYSSVVFSKTKVDSASSVRRETPESTVYSEVQPCVGPR